MMRPSAGRRQLEAAVAGAMVKYDWCVDEVAGLIEVADVGDLACRLVYQTAREMRGSGLGIGLESVVDEMAKAGRLQDAGGAAAVVELYEKAIGTAVVGSYCEKIREHALADRLYLVGAEIQQIAAERGRVADKIAECEQKVFALSKTNAQSDVRDADALVQEVFDRIDERARGGNTGLKVNLAALDQITTGLHAGELVVVAARPGVGKTTLAVNFAAEAAACGDRVMFVSLEMSGAEIVERMACKESGVPAQYVRQGALSASDAARFSAAGNKIRKWPLRVYDGPIQTTAYIASHARREDANGLKLVVIDYLQLISPENKRASRQEQVAAMSRDLKRLAREVKVPVVALAQLNRMSEQRTDRKPRLSDLRESGAIEADADVVLLLHQADPGQLDLIVAKQRNGPTGELKLLYEPQFHRVSDI